MLTIVSQPVLLFQNIHLSSSKIKKMRHLAIITFLWCGVQSLDTSLLEQNHSVQYLTYTKDSRNSSLDIRDVTFDDGQTTLFIIHGYLPTSLHQALKLIDSIFDSNQNVSRVVVISWINYTAGKIRSDFNDSKESKVKSLQFFGIASSTAHDEYNTPNYYKVATQHVPNLAEDLCEKLIFAQEKGAARMELLGHCVGAHVAAQAAKLFSRRTGDGIDQIIGRYS